MWKKKVNMTGYKNVFIFVYNYISLACDKNHSYPVVVKNVLSKLRLETGRAEMWGVFCRAGVAVAAAYGWRSFTVRPLDPDFT